MYDGNMQAPLALEIRSPMDLAYECFVKLGLRYICVLRDGHYAGLVSSLSLFQLSLELIFRPSPYDLVEYLVYPSPTWQSVFACG